MTDKPNQDFVTRLEVQNMTAAEIQMSTPHRNTPVLAVPREEKLAEAIQVRYVAAREGVKNLFLKWQEM